MRTQFRKWACVTDWSHYAETGETALLLVSEDDGSPTVRATVCLEADAPRAADDEVWLKTWSECEGLPEALAAAGVVVLTDLAADAGFSVARLAKLTAAAQAEVEAVYRADPNKAADRELRRALSRRPL